MITLILTLLFLNPTLAQQQSPFNLEGFQANQIFLISDGDNYAQSYLGEGLTPQDATLFRDELVMLKKNITTRFNVSNSVAGTPEVFAVDQRGELILAIETKKQKTEKSKVLKDLRDGNQLTLIHSKQGILDQITLPFVPFSVDLNASGTLGLVGGVKSVALIEIRNGKLKLSTQLAFPDTISLVQWHPTLPLFSVHLFEKNKIGFFRYEKTFLQVGDFVEVERDPFVGRFVKEGAYYVTSNWGRNFAPNAGRFERLPQDHSSLSLVRLDFQNGKHEVLQEIRTAPSPEGIAISPDGEYMVTSSMKNSLYSVLAPEIYDSKSALTLFQVTDDQNGLRLVKLAELTFEGILPEGVSFDLSGNYILATVFQDRPHQSKNGILKIFRIDFEKSPKLKHRLDFATPHGLHHVVVR